MLYVQTEVTTRCNLACVFCPRAAVIRSKKRRAVDIELSFYDQIIQAVEQFRKTLKQRILVSVSGLGEPLLYPDLFSAIRIIKKWIPRAEIRLNTNCELLKGDVARAIITSGVTYLTCSLNLTTPELYALYKRGGDYTNALNNVLAFLKLKGARAPIVHLRFNDFDVNRPFLKKHIQLWRRYLNSNDRLNMGGFSNWAGKIDRAKYVKRGMPKRVPCKYMRGRLTVNLEGEVYPCCLGIADDKTSSLYLGSMAQGTPLMHLYNGARMKQLRKLHNQRRYPFPCDVCDSWATRK